MKSLQRIFKGTIIHPQWLSDRCHNQSKKKLKNIYGQIILDVGSGDSKYPAKLISNNLFIRLDYPATNVRYQEKPDIYGNACQLPFNNESIDIIILLEVLEHIIDYDAALDEIDRVIKPGGKFYISIPFIYPIHDAPYDFRRHTFFGIKYEIENRGYDLMEITQHGNSFIVAIQLFNLAILELARKLYISNKILGVGFASLAAPICIMLNLSAIVFMKLDFMKASCFGYFIVAKKKD